ncbi:MAG: OadG family protein [Oscillospiraceae bacterium]|nr:OadG family protein [Oscillospiraceae bacterium]
MFCYDLTVVLFGILLGTIAVLLLCHVLLFAKLVAKVDRLANQQIQSAYQPLAAGQVTASATQEMDEELAAVITAAIAAYEQDK